MSLVALLVAFAESAHVQLGRFFKVGKVKQIATDRVEHNMNDGLIMRLWVPGRQREPHRGDMGSGTWDVGHGTSA